MSEKEILSIMKDNLILIEHSDKYKYDVYVDKDYRHKYFRSPEANYNFDIETECLDNKCILKIFDKEMSEVDIDESRFGINKRSNRHK